MSKIKICGLKRVCDVKYVNEAKVDFAGFILSKGYKRSIDKERFINIRQYLSPSIKAVGVFVNEDINFVNDYVSGGLIDLVQLHGNESASYCKMVADVPVIKAFQINGKNDFKFDQYDTDYFLFDSGQGSGKIFDWGSIPKCNKPIFLAGGLDESNIPLAKKAVNPYCFDLSSAAETNGEKDKEKILRLEREVRI